ncbi:PRK13768 family protein [[Eubacterium] cellulosolvens]
MKNINIFIVGTAGSGKSTLAYTFQRWMNNQGLDTIIVNLDPGVDYLMYTPEIDIREWISLAEVMREHNLGPNGAQIAAADLLVFNIDRVKKLIDEYKTNYILFDTPGQTELFTLRHSSTRIVETLGIQNSILLFLIDPFIAQTPSGFVAQLLLASTVQFRFSIPIFNVLSKSDMIEQEPLDTIIDWSNDLYKLEEALMSESHRMPSHLNLELLKVLHEMEVYKTLVPTSAESELGMEEIYNFAQQIFEGGEDITPD